MIKVIPSCEWLSWYSLLVERFFGWIVHWWRVHVIGFPDGKVGKESACNAGDTGDIGLIPGLGRSPEEGKGNPLQYSGLEKSHRQRSLMGYRPRGHIVRRDWATNIHIISLWGIQKTKIMASGPITSWQIDGETVETVTDFIFLSSKITADGECSHEIKRCLLLGRKVMTNLDSILKSRDITLSTKVHLSSQGFGFSSGHVWMWELDCEESWGLKNWCFWTVVLERTLESPLECKEIQSVHPKGDQSWVFIGRTGAEAPILWLPDVKNWLIWKDVDAGKDWRQEEKGTTED